MQTMVLRGRNFTADEDSVAPRRVVIVNQTFGNIYFPGKDPIGRHLHETKGPAYTIVGVVSDIRYEHLETAAVPQVYFPFLSSYPPPQGAAIVVRSALPLSAIRSALRLKSRTRSIPTLRSPMSGL